MNNTAHQSNILKEFKADSFLRNAYGNQAKALANAKKSLAFYECAKNPKNEIVVSRIKSLKKVIGELK